MLPIHLFSHNAFNYFWWPLRGTCTSNTRHSWFFQEVRLIFEFLSLSTVNDYSHLFQVIFKSSLERRNLTLIRMFRTKLIQTRFHFACTISILLFPWVFWSSYLFSSDDGTIMRPLRCTLAAPSATYKTHFAPVLMRASIANSTVYKIRSNSRTSKIIHAEEIKKLKIRLWKNRPFRRSCRVWKINWSATRSWLLAALTFKLTPCIRYCLSRVSVWNIQRVPLVFISGRPTCPTIHSPPAAKTTIFINSCHWCAPTGNF